jgi:branched-chain amino acid transport system permease protein
MGIDTTRLKLLALPWGDLRRRRGRHVLGDQGFVSPRLRAGQSIMVVSMVVLGGMGNVWGRDPRRGAPVPVPSCAYRQPVQRQLFGRMLIGPGIRMLIFGLRWCSSRSASGRPAPSA